MAGYLVAGAARVAFALGVPAETTDILRNLLYGRAFWSHGFRVYDLYPPDLAPATDLVLLWGTHTYDYPVAALFFFAALARLSTSLVVARLALLVVDLLAALMVSRVTGSRWAGLAWFAGPASLWWVSGEGQFEPLAVLFALLAVEALERDREVEAWAWLAAAIQVKVLPVLLLPWFLWRRPGPRAALAFALAMSPSLAATLTSSYLARMFEPGYWPAGFNAFAWDVGARWPLGWLPAWIAWSNAVLVSILLTGAIALLVRALGRREWDGAASCLPLVLFLVALRSMGWAQCWYLLLAPAFAAPIADRRARTALILLPLLEARGATALLLGPVGMVQWFPLEAWMRGLN